MKYKQFFAAVCLLFSATSIFAQLEQTIHQTFEVNAKPSIELNLYGEYELIPWAGNNILIETKVHLYNSSASILKHFIEKDKRYFIEVDTSATDRLRLYSHDMKRSALRTKTGAESTEVVETRVFIPDNYAVKDDKTLVLVLEPSKN